MRTDNFIGANSIISVMVKPSIRVIEPDEKLLITFPAGEVIESYILDKVLDKVKEFRESENTLVMAGLEVYVIKDGKQVLLKDELESVANVRLLEDVTK